VRGRDGFVPQREFEALVEDEIVIYGKTIYAIIVLVARTKESGAVDPYGWHPPA
jgi:hypothetical protein